jgi:flagellar hook-length control protein FliK
VGGTTFAATLAASTGADTLPAGTANQIVQAMRLQWANGAGEAHIQLQPDSFGAMTVSLRVESGQVFARVQADSPVVREWLQSNQSTLRQSMAEQNLTLNRLEVSEPPETRDGERRDGRQASDGQPQQRRQRRSAAAHDEFEVLA